ncbi:S-layer homology domain-containing protein [Bhargavaea cecembensis]|uniref:S-layer homology domain-containing protein n=1 Tax=Bhargavaea cecembensis TaxID=394098 RepID=UPI00058BAA0F|nr:S-layer homology domain-containing protein [Bhargavaea cecembensis]
MKANTYKRAAAIAAASALVGSAVVPVAAAPMPTSKKFSDVPATSSHYESILEAQALGIMTGYNDSTFKPDQKLNRGNVAKAFGKYVVAKSGMTLEEYIKEHNISEVKNFADVPDSWADKELVTYSKIVKEAGIFEGSNNQLMASKLMPRDQIAEVLVRAFDFKDKEGNPGIKDTKQSGYAKSIEIIYENGVSNANPYHPLSKTSRGQFASFLVRAYKVSEGLDSKEPLPVRVKSVISPDYALPITVGITPVLPETVKVMLEDGTQTTKAVKWDTSNLMKDEIGTYILTGTVADTDLKASFQVDVREQTYAEPITVYKNEDQNEIRVDIPYLTDSALDLSNYLFNGGPMPAGSKVQLKTGYIIITLGTDQEVTEDFEYTLEFTRNIRNIDGSIVVNNAWAANNGEEPENFTIKGTYGDNVSPTLVSAHYVIPSSDSEITDTLELTFSEEMAPLYFSTQGLDEDRDFDLINILNGITRYNVENVGDDLIFKAGGTQVKISDVDVENGKVYVSIPPMDIEQTSTITIVPEGPNNEALVITDNSVAKNPAVAPATKEITKDNIIVIEPTKPTE